MEAAGGEAAGHGEARDAAQARGPAADGAGAGSGGPADAGGDGPRIAFGRVAPDGLRAMRGLEAYLAGCGLPRPLLELVRIRASQMNGCTYCLDMHTQDALAAGESEQRLHLVAAWREAPCFTARERAALAWAEAVTRPDLGRVADDVYASARAAFSEKETSPGASSPSTAGTG